MQTNKHHCNNAACDAVLRALNEFVPYQNRKLDALMTLIIFAQSVKLGKKEQRVREAFTRTADTLGAGVDPHFTVAISRIGDQEQHSTSPHVCACSLLAKAIEVLTHGDTRVSTPARAAKLHVLMFLCNRIAERRAGIPCSAMLTCQRTFAQQSA